MPVFFLPRRKKNKLPAVEMSMTVMSGIAFGSGQKLITVAPKVPIRN